MLDSFRQLFINLTSTEAFNTHLSLLHAFVNLARYEQHDIELDYGTTTRLWSTPYTQWYRHWQMFYFYPVYGAGEANVCTCRPPAHTGAANHMHAGQSRSARGTEYLSPVALVEHTGSCPQWLLENISVLDLGLGIGWNFNIDNCHCKSISNQFNH